MKDFSFRSSVDKADIENSTNLGRTLKSVWYGKPATPDAPPQEVKPQSAVDLARDVKEFPLSRCQAIFKRDANTPGESYRDLTPEQYQSAKRAAKFLGV